jgi:hypothetical protein
MRRFIWWIAVLYVGILGIVSYWLWPFFVEWPVIYTGVAILVGMFVIMLAPYNFPQGGRIMATTALVSGVAIAIPSLVQVYLLPDGEIWWLLNAGVGFVATLYGWALSPPKRTGAA